MDRTAYQAYQRKKLEECESMCARCGECCGALDGDPCANLTKDAGGATYRCAAYENRLGPQRTVSGKVFNCITIEKLREHDFLRPGCPYDGLVGSP